MTDAIRSLSLAVLALSAFLVLLHAWRGSSAFDRALALETLALVVVATLLVHADLHTDAALGLALFAFVSTVLLGYFLGRGDFPHE